MRIPKNIFVAALILNIPLPAIAEPSISHSYEFQKLEDFKVQRNADQFIMPGTPTGHRIFALPNEVKVDEEVQKGIETFLNSCLGCQEIPEIDGGALQVVIPKPTSSSTDICKKYPGKYGCPEQ